MSLIDSERAPCLLLLPAPPEPATSHAVRAAYHLPLCSVIARLSNITQYRDKLDVAPILVVAVALPVLTPPHGSAARLLDWKKSQSLIAEIYSVSTAICSEKLIATDLGAADPGAVDVRVVVVHDDPSVDSGYETDSSGNYRSNNTTVLDIAAFASTVLPWFRIFHPSSEAGYELLNTYLTYAERRQKLRPDQLVAVEGGLTFSNAKSAQTHVAAQKGYRIVCLGGTFDHLHPGHKLLLHAASLLLNVERHNEHLTRGGLSELVVGISSDRLLMNKKYAEELQSWDTRAHAVLSFLCTLLGSSTITRPAVTSLQAETKEVHATFRDGDILVRCVDFHDVYGPTVKEEGIQALVVSQESRSGGEAVNQKRQDQGWNVLDVFEVNVLESNEDSGKRPETDKAVSSFASKISSTEIRRQKAHKRQATLVELEAKVDGSTIL